MKRWFKIFLCLASIVAVARGEGRAREFSANIQSVERASNGVYLNFTVTGAPDFIDIEGSPTLTGIYREEQNVDMVALLPGQVRALITPSTEIRFFRIRLMSATDTNVVLLPLESQRAFGNGGLPNHITPFRQVYAVSEFLEAAGAVLNIHGIAFRLNDSSATGDITVERLTIGLGVFVGDMSELGPHHVYPVESSATVFDREKVQLIKNPADSPPNAIDLQILFEKPYRYSLDSGHLVMSVDRIEVERTGFAIDVVNYTYGRGALYEDDFPNPPRRVDAMVVTKFLYTVIPEP